MNCVEVFGEVRVDLRLAGRSRSPPNQGDREEGPDHFMFTVGNNHLIRPRLPVRGAGRGNRNRCGTGDYTQVETVGRKLIDSGQDKHSSRKK